MPSIFGAKIKALRQQKRMTLEQMAAVVGTSKSHIWALENRDVPPQPSAEKIFAIARTLDVTPEYLLTDEQTTPDADVLDEAFYRKYRRMPADTKRRLRQILDAWDDER